MPRIAIPTHTPVLITKTDFHGLSLGTMPGRGPIYITTASSAQVLQPHLVLLTVRRGHFTPSGVEPGTCVFCADDVWVQCTTALVTPQGPSPFATFGTIQAPQVQDFSLETVHTTRSKFASYKIPRQSTCGPNVNALYRVAYPVRVSTRALTRQPYFFISEIDPYEVILGSEKCDVISSNGDHLAFNETTGLFEHAINWRKAKAFLGSPPPTLIGATGKKKPAKGKPATKSGTSDTQPNG